jgi:hypothetical protein
VTFKLRESFYLEEALQRQERKLGEVNRELYRNDRTNVRGREPALPEHARPNKER